jgi:exodeoxyribonuclease VII large subunit
VSHLIAGANRVLDRLVGTIWVEGEVESLVRAASGHLYFSLKDARSQIRAVMWRSDAARLRFRLEDGLSILCRGRVAIYDRDGKFQFYAQSIEPAGLGADALAFEQLRAKLAAEGLFAPERKRRLPLLPRRIGVVTSKSGAAVRDIIRAVQRRFPVPILIADARVQGPSAPPAIARAIGALCRCPDVDVVIVGRGGGSAGDLAAFNDERVVRAVAACAVPVISAVGHEIDVTISDLVADHRALTPSHAITDLTPDRVTLVTGLFELQTRLKDRVFSRIKQALQKLDSVADRRAFRSPLDRIRDLEKRLDELDGRLGRSANIPVERARQRVASLASQLESLSPLHVLARGYSLTRTPDGHVISDAARVRPGDLITTRLAHGELTSRVEDTRLAPQEMP